jgi:hypothetical protein
MKQIRMDQVCDGDLDEDGEFLKKMGDEAV